MLRYASALTIHTMPDQSADRSVGFVAGYKQGRADRKWALCGVR
jgi:hypothetical protein